MTENTCELVKTIKEKAALSPACDKKFESIMKAKKPRRKIYVHTYPMQSYNLNLKDHLRKSCALSVKRFIANGLHISPSHVQYFALCSGPLNNPIKMYCDNDLLPEDISHFSLLRTSFFLNREEQYLQQDKAAKQLMFNEMMAEFLNKMVVPIPDFETHSQLVKMKESNDITGFWSTFNNHSRCAQICGITFWKLDSPSGSIKSLPIRIAVDMAGIHFFDMGGTIVVMSWYWDTVVRLKVQVRPEMIFYFSVVVRENKKFSLKDICVYTSSCEYILSMAEVILKVPCKSLRARGNPNQSIESGSRQFSPKESQSKLYLLIRQPELDEFFKYTDPSEISELSLLNPAYCQPLGYYIFNADHEPLPDGTNVLSFDIFYSSRKSFTESKENLRLNYFVDFVTIQMFAPPQYTISSRELIQEAGNYLHLRRESLEFFGLYQVKNGRLIRLLGSHDPTDIEFKLVLKPTVLYWSKEQDLKLWEMLREDERAVQIIFWEVVSAHAGVIKHVDLIFSYFTYTCSLLEVVFALGAIADIHGADDCILLWKLTNIPNDGYSPGKRVLLSLNRDGLHFWESVNGRGIINWGWTEVNGIHRDEQQQTLTFRIYVAPGWSPTSNKGCQLTPLYMDFSR